jgi:hypothetical protein
VDDVLTELRITRDDARRWYRAGWLSFSIDDTCDLDLTQQEEIVFIRSIAISGLGEFVLDRLLQELRRPFAYNSRRITYSFEYGWVEPVKEEPVEFGEEHVVDWLEELTSSRDVEKLQYIAAKIVEHLGTLASEEDGAEHPG